MDREELKDKIQEIFREVFDNDELTITDSTSSDDIDEWDSLGHIQLIKAIEKELKIKLTAQEIRSWEDVGEMIDSLIGKI